ncbi:flagellar biosynthesis anti-sigma factor FlgM [Parasphingorhabdus halotolerans]|uniref:Negative regulator of flagellin synthesis n=1 Tax=Parasphingorhabdus halotolerans TaxID=2725558 RepID=A0A6H2DHZ9_9SPHN|nr:flagellar biosynthesis anti-sigma factor FlgM [Parasphingorhabdus halotolerans]QJB68010.1 flagellar biosynthesis anti-sigma factor FlgM [Parasphingorhabdus halotolerans]
MKPVDSYLTINTRLDRPALNEAAAKNVEAAAGTGKATVPSSISTTASQLATEKPPFDAQKVSEIKQQIASGNYQVDTDALAAKMLDAGVLGVASKK